MNTEPETKLDMDLAKLPRAIEPSRDLWPGIAARIAQRPARSTRRAWNYGLAAAAVIVIGVAATMLTLSTRTPSPSSNIAVVVPTTSPAPEGSNDLRAQFTAQLASDTSLPPAARKALLDNLQLLHDSILRTQAAVTKYPNDVNLRSLLLDLYQQEARLMSEAQQAQIQTTVRTSI